MNLRTESLGYTIGIKKLLAEITLTFSQGHLYGILGPNGSGKSTLLKCLTGIWKPTTGKVFWQETPLHGKNALEISRTLSLVPQNPPLPFDFTVWDLVSMGRYPYQSHRTAKGRCPEVVEWALTVVDAWHLREQKVNSLSAGEKQRVYIARTLSTESPVILLDEPTSCLDIKHQLQIWQLLRTMVAQGKIVIVTVHDLYATERFCDRVAVLNQGFCVAQGGFTEVMQPPLLRRVFGIVPDEPRKPSTTFQLP